jgi:Protein of unknown function (DUF3570)
LRLHLIAMLLRRLLALLLLASASQAAVLPEDRADLMYHLYDGGGLTVDGPSVLVRKKFGESFSVTGSYYVDAITSASIDVVTTASPYEERHTEKGLSVDYLHGKTTYSLGYMNSEESDYTSDSMSLGLSQDMFGDLTTVSIGYSQGWDTVGKRGEPDFAEDVDRRSYRLGVSQVLTRTLLLSLNYEAITEAGYLHNPYRSQRFYGPAAGTYSYGPEVYPETRTGNAGAARLKYFLPWRAAVEGGYRFYADSWGINAHTASVEYVQPMWNKWVFTGSYRWYSQTAADFYSDLFPQANYQNFMGRDKETASFTNNSIGVGASYEFPVTWFGWLKKGTVNAQYNFMMFDYDDFRDLTDFPSGTAEPGTEPLYSMDANVIQFYVSFWF